MSEIPAKVVEKIKLFMRERATGSVTLHFNEGHINAFEIKEHASVQRSNGADKPDTRLTPKHN